ncbi:MAG: metallophosphoesterase [Mediterranea sp.]|jgi:predicted MPP superfamily phosphohydrolase|nr:metallophosphoesterase [Mediterranea sp.]
MSFLLIFIAIVLFYLGVNAWLFHALLQSVSGWPPLAKWGVGIVYWLLVFAFFLMQALRDKDLPPTLAHLFYWVSTGWMAFFLYLALSYAIASLLRLAGLHLPHAFACCVGLTLLLLAYGYVRFDHPATRRVTVELSRHPSVDSLRVVAISDVHLGYGITRRRLRTYVDKINAERPDLILIAGDLIDMSTVPLHRERMQEELRRLKAPMGIYMVPGNHEYISGIRKSMDFIAQTPITLLRDTVVVLPGGIQLIGRDDRSNPRRKTIDQLMASVDKDAPTILIDHQPANETLSQLQAVRVDFGFFGHTHHGQLWPLSWLTDAIYTQSHGYRTYGDTHVYVSSGLGLWGPPFRIGTEGEIGVMVFMHARP